MEGSLTPGLTGAVGTATPTMVGRTKLGDLGSSVRSRAATWNPAVFEGVEGGAVTVAADDGPVEPVHPVLPFRGGRIVSPDVFEEKEPASGSQHPADLPDGAGLVVDPAEHERRDHDIESVSLRRAGPPLAPASPSPPGR